MPEYVELDLTTVKKPRELQELLYSVFRFPGWYGFNWNAFLDSITDPEQSSLPAVLIIRGWGALADRLPSDAQLLREDLQEVADSRPECRQVWTELISETELVRSLE